MICKIPMLLTLLLSAGTIFSQSLHSDSPIKVTSQESDLQRDKLFLTSRSPSSFNLNDAPPLFLNRNDGEYGKILFYEIITKGYKPSLPGSIWLYDSNRISFITCLPQQFYRLAYGGERRDLDFDLISGFPNNRTIIKIKDSTAYTFDKMHPIAYNYDITLPNLTKDSTGIHLLFSTIRATLLNNFPYEARIIRKKVLCLVLVRTSKFNINKSKTQEMKFDYDAFSASMQGYPFPDFISYLRYYFFQMESRPLIDESGLTDAIDLKLNANLSDPKALSKALQPYGLDLVEEYRDIEMLLITDKSKRSSIQ